MKNAPFFSFVLIIVSFCFSCKKQPTILPEQAYFDSLMNEQPKKALEKLGQLKAGKYSHASEAERMKLDLMIVKAGDKAFIPKTTDSITRKLVEYYEKNGTRNELMEAYFYHGSAYRDLHDTPKALRYYLKAKDVIDTCDVNFDWYLYSVLLEQLAGVYNLQRDYLQAIACTKEILAIGDKYVSDSIWDLENIARYYNCIDSIQQALTYNNRALEAVKKEEITPNNLLSLGEMLGFYVSRYQLKQAEECYQLLKEYKLHELPPNVRAAIGDYFKSKQLYKDAYKYHSSADSCFTDFRQIQSSKRDLYEIKKSLGNENEALRFAEEFMQYTDSVVDAEKKEQAQQINNAYKYHKDELYELELERKAEKRTKIIWMVIALASFGLIFGIYLHRLYIKNKNKVISQKDETISFQQTVLNQKDETISLQQTVLNQKDETISLQQTVLNQKDETISLQQTVLNQKDETISHQQNVLNIKDQTIGELEIQKTTIEEQLRQIEMNLAHKKNMALSVSDVRSLFLNEDGSAKGELKESDWSNLFDAIDAVDPEFIHVIHTEYSGLSDFDKNMLCLMKIGMKNAQIAEILHRSRSVITKHCIKLKERHGMDVEKALGRIFND